MKFGVESGIELYCVECGKIVMTTVESGKNIFPRRIDLAKTVCLVCPYCKNYVSADALRKNDTLLSWKKRHNHKVIPNPTLRKARHRIHDLVDPCFRAGLISRKEIYKRLSRAAGEDFHNAALSSLEQYKKVHKEAKKIRREAEKVAKDRLPKRPQPRRVRKKQEKRRRKDGDTSKKDF